MIRHLHLLWMVPVAFATSLVVDEVAFDMPPVEAFRRGWSFSYGILLGWVFAHCWGNMDR